MATSAISINRNTVPLTLLGAAAALLILGVLTGQAAAFGLSDRTAFWVITVIGFTMCAFSPLGKGTLYGWTNPLHLAGYVLGGLALLLMVAVLTGKPLPEWLAVHSGVPALGALMAIKVLIAAFYPRR